jgi:integrase
VVSALREWKLACPKGKLNLVFPNGAGNVESHANIVNRELMPLQIAAGVCTIVKDADGKVVLDDRASPSGRRNTPVFMRFGTSTRHGASTGK